MKFFIKQKKGFTILELMIVVVIVGILGNMSTTIFFKFKEKALYENFIYTLQHFVQDAKNMALVNESKFSGGNFLNNTGYGVFIKKDVGSQELTGILFKDINQNGELDLGVDEEIKVEKITNAIKLDLFWGINSESETEQKNFNEVTISFQPDPNPISEIKTDSVGTLRRVELKFYHPTRDGMQILRKKFSYDVISRIAQINDYPILTDAEKTNDVTIMLTANEDIEGNANKEDFKINHKINHNLIPINISNASISGSRSIILTTDLSGLDKDYPIEVIYNSKDSIISEEENLSLHSQKLEINL